MVNSESDFNENYFEKTKQNVERLGIVKVRGRSMLGKIIPVAKIAYKIISPGTQYGIGDIIVFNRDGMNTIHEIVDIIIAIWYLVNKVPFNPKMVFSLLFEGVTAGISLGFTILLPFFL